MYKRQRMDFVVAIVTLSGAGVVGQLQSSYGLRAHNKACSLYTSEAAEDLTRLDPGGSRSDGI